MLYIHCPLNYYKKVYGQVLLFLLHTTEAVIQRLRYLLKVTVSGVVFSCI